MISLALIICCIASIVLGYIVLVRDIKKVTNILFGGIAICFAVWIAAIFLFLRTDSAHDALIFAKIFYAIAVVFPVLLVLFALLYPVPDRIKPVTIGFVIMGGAAVLIPLFISPIYIIQSVTVDQGVNQGLVDKTSYIYFSIYFVIYFLIGISIALKKFFTNKGNERMQAGLYAFGILLNSIPGFYANLLLPYQGDYSLIWVGPVASIFFLGLVTYGIVRHSMFDIRLVIARTATYVLAVLIMAVIYGGLLVGLSRLLLVGTGRLNGEFLVNLGITIILALTFPYLKNFFDKVTDKIFFKDTYDLQSSLNRMSDIGVEEIKLGNILRRAKKLINGTLKPKSIGIIVLDADGVVVGNSEAAIIDEQELKALDMLTRKNSIKYKDAHFDELLTLDGFEIEAVLRLQTSTQRVGYVIMSGKKSGDAYRGADLHLIQAIKDELSVSIQNALRFGEIQAFNNTLEARVAEATSELRSSNKKLRDLDETKDEFISMASHQLRTPLTSVKGYISMLLEGDMGDLEPAQRKVLEEAYNSSQRMVYLIGDFLNLSRLRTGKFILELSPVSLPEVIEQEINQLRAVAKLKNIKIDYTSPHDFPILPLDETKLRQVMMNFIDNAIYYSQPEGGKVEISLIKHSTHVSFKVIDDGIGVPKNELSRLFTKFYRAENAKRARPDGTGIGLFMAKKVIVAHGGSILFESKENHGSTFGFRLPVVKDKNS